MRITHFYISDFEEQNFYLYYRILEDKLSQWQYSYDYIQKKMVTCSYDQCLKYQYVRQNKKTFWCLGTEKCITHGLKTLFKDIPQQMKYWSMHKKDIQEAVTVNKNSTIIYG